MKQTFLGFWDNNSELVFKIGHMILLSLVVLAVCWVLSRFLKNIILRTSHKMENFDITLVPILSTVLSYVVYLVGAIIILDIFGVNTASLIALLGTIGLAVGFALKDTLSNIAAGMMLLILRPFRVGETIEFGSVTGKVKEINLFTTILETADGLFVSSPNGAIWGNSIKNFNRNGKRRLDIVVGIAYSDSIDAGIDVLRKIISDEPRFLKDPEAITMVTSMGDSCVNLQLRAWTSVDDYWQTNWDLTKRIKEEIEAAGLSIPFPQREVNVINK